jgi:hypothetical protein
MDNFKFCFKGNRTYIHGSDIYNAIAKYLKAKYGYAITNIELSMHKLASHNMIGEVLDVGQPILSVSPAVICRFDIAEKTKTLYLIETDMSIDCRYEFAEESIIRNSHILQRQKSITLMNQTPYSSIEIIIALNKKLMQYLFAGEKGNWLFTRLTLKQLLPVSSDAMFTVAFKQNLSYRLTCSTIAIGKEHYGEIFFSLGKG